MGRTNVPIVIHFTSAACLAALVVACFGGVLFAGRQFGFRDAAAFYYPLYQRVQQEWQAGRLPLWEPEDNGGMPLLGNPTAAVLYPGKLLYAALPYRWAARTYVVAHVLLAAVAMASALRGWGASPEASVFGGLAYAFGAPVLLQYSNVVFLVGAAWMPLGFRAADRWVRLGRRQGLIGLALVLAMQTLGGDPEIAYLTAVCAGGYAVGLAAARSGSDRILMLAGSVAVYLGLAGWSGLGVALGASAWWPSPRWLMLVAWGILGAVVVVRWQRRRAQDGLETALVGLVGACALGLALTGVQLVPTLEFIRLSLRASEGSVEKTLYGFSVHPARVVEWVWPNAFGLATGINHRWLEALPPTYDVQIWSQSLYSGGLPLILALSAAGFRRGPSWRVWLTVVVVVAVLASFGRYASPLFWAGHISGWRQTQGAVESPAEKPSNVLPQDGDGSVYWFLATALPGFGSFRYPGKLWVLAAMGLCGLAGLGWDEWARNRSRRGAVLATAGLTLSLSGLAMAVAARDAIAGFLLRSRELATTAFGPLDVPGALGDLRVALVTGVATSALALVLALYAYRRNRLCAVLATVGLTLDLALANAGWVVTVPQALFDAPPHALDVIAHAERADASPGPYRIHRPLDWPPAIWSGSSSPRRSEEIVRWERDTLRARYAIPYFCSYVYAMGTTELSELVPFFQWFPVHVDDQTARLYGLRPGQRVAYFTRRGFDLWGARYFILPARVASGSPIRGVLSFLPATTEIDPDPKKFEGPGGAERKRSWLDEEDVQILRNDNALPRAWIVHQVRLRDPVAPTDREGTDRLMAEILYQDDDFWHASGRPVIDLRRVAWVEVAPKDRRRVAGRLSGRPPGPSERVTVDRYEPQHVELTATLESAGLVILADVFYPGWRLTIDGEPAEILRVNRLMRGALVAAGAHRLSYRYEPGSLWLGACLSVAGVLGLAGLARWAKRQPMSTTGSA